MQRAALSMVLSLGGYIHACQVICTPIICKQGNCHVQQGTLQMGRRACPPQAAERPAATRAAHLRTGT